MSGRLRSTAQGVGVGGGLSYVGWRANSPFPAYLCCEPGLFYLGFENDPKGQTQRIWVRMTPVDKRETLWSPVFIAQQTCHFTEHGQSCSYHLKQVSFDGKRKGRLCIQEKNMQQARRCLSPCNSYCCCLTAQRHR